LLRSFALKRLPQLLVGGNPSGDEECGDIVGAGCRQGFSDQVFDDSALEGCDEVERELVAVGEVILQLWLCNVQQGLPPRFDGRTHVVRFNVPQDCRFDAAVRKIKTRTVIVFIDYSAVVSAAAVAMLDLGRRKFHGSGIPMRSETIHGWATWVSQA
jgi:hypothetical protein